MADFAVILAAAGKSSRFTKAPSADGSADAATGLARKKVFAPLAGKPVWLYAAQLFCSMPEVGELVLVLNYEDQQEFETIFAKSWNQLAADSHVKHFKIVEGGEQRADSVSNGLACVQQAEFVAIHDAARACLGVDDAKEVFSAARDHGAAILACPCHSTLKRTEEEGSRITDTVPRKDLWLAQTPQAFRTSLLREAYASHPNPSEATDDALIVEHSGHPVHIVGGSPFNIKITTPDDLAFAEQVLSCRPSATLKDNLE